MTRQSLHAEPAKKSKWVNARGKKPEKALKPTFPPVTGTYTCPVCHCPNGITTYTQVVVEWPFSKVWFSGEACKGKITDKATGKDRPCDETLSGWLIIEEVQD